MSAVDLMPSLRLTAARCDFDRLDAQVQRRADLLGALAFGDELNDAPLARRQHFPEPLLARQVEGFEQPLPHMTVKERLVRRQRLDRRNQQLIGTGFGKISARTGCESGIDLRLAVMHREYQYLDLRVALADLPCRLDAVHQRNAVIEDRHVGPGFPRLCDRVLAIGRLGDDLPAVVRLQNRPQAGSNDLMIIGDEDACHRRLNRQPQARPRSVADAANAVRQAVPSDLPRLRGQARRTKTTSAGETHVHRDASCCPLGEEVSEKVRPSSPSRPFGLRQSPRGKL